MVEDRVGYQYSLNGDDCNKAAGVLKRWQILLLLVVGICLLLQQASFYFVDQGYIKIDGHAHGDEPATADQAEGGNPVVQLVAKWLPADFASQITFDKMALTINLVNVILILAITIYCLTFLLCLQVSLQGRLGGIKHITRAFVLSFSMLVLLLPWQKIFGGVVTGAVFSPQEMVTWYSSKTEDVQAMAFYYLRFGGYGLLMFLLLMASYLGSLLWARSALRRIEIAEAEIDWHSALRPYPAEELSRPVGTL